MFTDIVGYTEQMSKSESKSLDTLEKKRSILKPLLKKYKGTFVKEIGDGTLSYFESAVNAATCAVKLQETTYDDKEMNIRVGIHIGDIVFKDGDVFGGGVNVASRLESIAPAGGVCVSKSVYDELSNQDDFDGIELGLQSLKGVGRLVEVFGLKGDKLNEPKPSEYQENKVAVHSDDEVPSIAIIPFKNKGKEEDAFYAYGICTDLISDCRSAGLIRVASLDRVEEVTASSLDELAMKLDVRYTVEGTLWKMDDLFQLSLELYDTRKSKVLWSDRWQEKWDNLPTIKRSLAIGLLTALDTKLQIEIRVETTKAEAYELYLKGCVKLRKIRNKEDTEIAKKILMKAIDLDDNLIEAKNELWSVYQNREKGLKMLELNLNQAQELGSNRVIAQSYFHIGWNLFISMSQELAIENFSKAIKYFEESGDRIGAAESASSLGMAYTFLGQIESAIASYSKSNSIYKEIEYKIGILDCRLCESSLYFYQNKLDKALELMENMEKYLIEEEYFVACAVLFHFRGCIYFYKLDFNNASMQLEKSCELWKQLDAKNNYVWTLSWSIISNLKLGTINQKDNIALLHSKIDDGWLEDIDFPEVHYNLFKIYSELNDYNKAKVHLDLGYNKLITQSKRIKKEEFRESFLQSRCHNELVRDWESLNKEGIPICPI
jgi:TolB-like protein